VLRVSRASSRLFILFLHFFLQFAPGAHSHISFCSCLCTAAYCFVELIFLLTTAVCREDKTDMTPFYLFIFVHYLFSYTLIFAHVTTTARREHRCPLRAD